MRRSTTALLALLAMAGCPSSRNASAQRESHARAGAVVSSSAPAAGAAPGTAARTTARRAALPLVRAPQMFRGGAARLGRTTRAIPDKLPHIVWRFRAGRAVFASPQPLADGSVIAASIDGRIHRIDGRGRAVWSRHLGGAIFATPAVTARGIFAGSDADRVAAIDLRGGSVRWTFRLGSCAAVPGVGPESVRCDADSSVALVGDALYFGGDALYALDGQGKQRWRAALPDHAQSSPAVGPDGSVYIATRAGSVHAFSKDGTPRWTFRARWQCDGSPAVWRGRVFVGCDDRRVYALDAPTGKTLWKFRTRGAVRASAAVTSKGVVVIGSYDQRVLALDGASGALRWAFQTSGAVHASATVDAAGRVLVGSRDDHLYALGADGGELWRLRLGGDIDGEARIGDDGMIYVGADDGVVYALR